MRLLGLGLLVLGILAVAAGAFAGCGALFSWNGRHPVEVRRLQPGMPLAYTFTAVPDRRYTLGIDVVFDPAGLPTQNGAVRVEAKLPLTVSVSSGGDPLVSFTGWLDPDEPPTLLVGAGAAADPKTAGRSELFAERLVGPFRAATSRPIDVRVDLGVDKVGAARVVSARVVLYDDATPGSIAVAFAVGGGGVVFAGAGIAVLIVASLRRRRGRRK